jgi:cytochrome d ubiquinol oxidase subunit II
MSYEFLQILWFILIAVLWIGFHFLEGFDFGVGMLLPFLGKTDIERRTIINTIGSVWDGNEVWLLTAGGATFAAFPHWYATMFSGFYLALFLLLVGLIIRGISFEYRSKDANPAWRNRFDWMIAIGSFMAALLLGAAFANLAKGQPIGADMNLVAPAWLPNNLGVTLTLLNPYGLLGGLTTVAVFLLHGANFLVLKLEGSLHTRAVEFSKKLWIGASVLYVLLGIWTYVAKFWANGKINPGVVPLAAMVMILLTGYFINKQMEGWAFISTGLNIVLTQVTFFLMTFPNVMLSTLNPDWSLTVFNASSSQYTLTVMSIIALIFVPIVLAYQGWSYYMFRKRISADKKTLVY